MKKFLLITGIVLSILSCGDGTDPYPWNNHAPSVPVLLEPTDNLLCIDNNLVFKWEASTDTDGDDIKYTLDIAKDNQFAQTTFTYSNLTATSQTILLDKDTPYYWRVKAVDDRNRSSYYSDVFQFYTEGLGEVNHLPFSPALIYPESHTVISAASVSFAWGSSDVDNDVLTYDVYLDTINPPITIVTADHVVKNYTTTTSLVTGATYYWNVVVKDGKGGVAASQVWDFTTE